MLVNYTFDVAKRLGYFEASVLSEGDRIEPEFAFTLQCANVDMRRFVFARPIEMKPESTNSQDGRHFDVKLMVFIGLTRRVTRFGDLFLNTSTLMARGLIPIR